MPYKKQFELFGLFVGIPIVLALPVYLVPKLIIGALGLLYVLLIVLKQRRIKIKTVPNINWPSFLKKLVIRFTIIAISTIFIVKLISPESMFLVPKNKPGMWVIILFVYSVFSVYPQELLFRPFFFNRYSELFESERMLVFVNALLFSLAHLFFGNTLVLIITFVGGLIFAITYLKTKSFLLVTIEHSIYGCWLFTVGMGDMLGFPS